MVCSLLVAIVHDQAKPATAPAKYAWPEVIARGMLASRETEQKTWSSKSRLAACCGATAAPPKRPALEGDGRDTCATLVLQLRKSITWSIFMTADDVLNFIKTNHRAVLSTKRRDGGVQMSPVAVSVDDDGTLMISTSERTAKTKNLRRDPTAYLCVLN